MMLLSVRSEPMDGNGLMMMVMSTPRKCTVDDSNQPTLQPILPSNHPFLMKIVKRTRSKDLPSYPPLRASNIPADVLTRRMKSIRIHRHWKLPLLRNTSIHCKNNCYFLLLCFRLWIVGSNQYHYSTRTVWELDTLSCFSFLIIV